MFLVFMFTRGVAVLSHAGDVCLFGGDRGAGAPRCSCRVSLDDVVGESAVTVLISTFAARLFGRGLLRILELEEESAVLGVVCYITYHCIWRR